MSILILTGAPGVGKTSQAVHQLINAKERPTFTLRKSTEEISYFDDFASWQDLPDGSLVFVDEAQLVPGLAAGEPLLSHVRALETHRHRGFDFIFAAQLSILLNKHLIAIATYIIDLNYVPKYVNGTGFKK